MICPLALTLQTLGVSGLALKFCLEVAFSALCALREDFAELAGADGRSVGARKVQERIDESRFKSDLPEHPSASVSGSSRARPGEIKVFYQGGCSSGRADDDRRRSAKELSRQVEVDTHIRHLLALGVPLASQFPIQVDGPDASPADNLLDKKL